MAFVLVVPSLTIGCEWIFGLTAMWAHPCQAHLHTLGEVAHKLILLASEGADWPYTFVGMNNTMPHAPLSSEGHIGSMTDGAPSMNACSHLHQLQVQKILQSGGWVVCPEGLNGELKALQFNFEELPLWNVAAGDEPIWDPPLIEVDLSGVEPEDIITTLQAPTTTPVPPLFPAAVIDPPCDIAMAINLHIQGALEWLQWTSPMTSTPISQHSTPGRKPPLAALGALPSTRAEDPLGLEGMDSAIPGLMGTSTQVPCRWPCLATSPVSLMSVTCHPHLPCQKHWRWLASPPFHSPRLPPGQTNWPARWGAFAARANECGPSTATHNQGHYGLQS